MNEIITDRVAAKVRKQFGPHAERACFLIEETAARVFSQDRIKIGGAEAERLLAAVLIASAADIKRLPTVLRLTELDWRDLLVETRLACDNSKMLAKSYFDEL
ncbi:hypothetical protein [Sinosporangium siamense]|uniref:Uncharacterized protein n=1 Tax=Sinosporangium siamense TaxID=1367973 RepID=A0A919RME3_9ACTN|nr:hypothetical protein [Sinosporangium siamense]GII95862.1 hypothetical protein Ssi02_60930 [Sinosporangium siamense]